MCLQRGSIKPVVLENPSRSLVDSGPFPSWLLLNRISFWIKNPVPPPLIEHLKNTYLSIRSLTQGLFLSLSTTWKLTMGLSRGQRRSSATSLTTMVSSCVSSAFFPANCCLLLLLEGSHHWWKNSPSFLQHGMGLVQGKEKKKAQTSPKYSTSLVPSLYALTCPHTPLSLLTCC